MWSVLTLSLLIDGYVLVKTVQGIRESKPKNVAFTKHLKTASGVVVAVGSTRVSPTGAEWS